MSPYTLNERTTPKGARRRLTRVKAQKQMTKLSLLKTGQCFQDCKTTALQCRKLGDADGARFWAAQARACWRLISAWLDA